MKGSAPLRRLLLAATALTALCAVGCGGVTDPRQRVLDQRARWNVQLLSWSQSPDGTVTLGARLSGPPNSDLEQLTVRVQLYDADENVIGSEWHSFDLSDVERGGPVDLNVRIREFPHEVAGAGFDLVLQPTAEEESHIPELPQS